MSNVDSFGLVICDYSISQHKLYCESNDGATAVFIQDGVWSGNPNAYDGNCLNNPDCSNIKNIGPIPPGEYGMKKDSNNDMHWTLNRSVSGPETIGGIRRFYCNSEGYRCGFKLHPGSISAGCITIDKNNNSSMQKYERLNEILEKDSMGFNWLRVKK